MASPAQILANQQNCKKSTGPVTPEGKAASSRNHTTHGLCAADPVLPHEDRNAFNALLDRYKSEYPANTAHEEFLVFEMAGARWKLNRVESIQTSLLAAVENPAEPAALEAVINSPAFTKLERYRASLERTYHRCARELRVAVKQQIEANSTELAEKKFDALLKAMLNAPPPGFKFQPRLVPLHSDPAIQPQAATP